MEFCMVIIGSVALAAGMDAAKIELKKLSLQCLTKRIQSNSQVPIFS